MGTTLRDLHNLASGGRRQVRISVHLADGPIEMIRMHEPGTHRDPLTCGPAELVRHFGLPHEDGYVDACHLRCEARCGLRERFPKHQVPPTVNGADNRS